jgi:GTPase SAR1 family protein
VKLIIFDIIRNPSIIKHSEYLYEECKGVMLVYDTSDSTSFSNLKEWLKTIQENADQGVEIILVANKIDLPRQVSTDEGKSFSSEVKISLVETSAKTGTGVDKAFETLIRNIIKNQNERILKEQTDKENKEKPLNIEKEDPNKKKKASGCCSG